MMRLPHWLVTAALCLATTIVVLGTLFNVYRSLGGEPMRPTTYNTPRQRAVALLFDAVAITTWFIVLSLAWGAR